MNCKQGDLALVVKGRETGQMVTCLKLVADGEMIQTTGGISFVGNKSLPAWHVDRKMVWYRKLDKAKVLVAIARDKDLMPIRPQSEEDVESLEERMSPAVKRAVERFQAALRKVTLK